MSSSKTDVQADERSAKLAAAMADISERSKRLIVEYLERSKTDDGYEVMHPDTVMRTFQEVALKSIENPASMIREQLAFWSNAIELWSRTTARALRNEQVAPVIVPAPEDRRFKAEAWAESYVFDYIKQCYLLAARHTQAAVSGIEGLDPHTARKAQFYTRQIVDALSPTNFAATNPQVLKRTAETRGENLVEGLKHLLEDLERGHGRLSLKMTDLSAFRLGDNIAATPGKVVFQNALMQLLQYEPTTDTVHERPLLIVPPWINKFYILDLTAKNSFIRWAVDQGHTVFVISWVNPDASLAGKSFEDYMLEGPLAALEAIHRATGQHEANVVGYCIGGTLTASTLAYMAAKDDRRITSATYLTSLLDFSDVGEIAVFIDEEQLARVEEHMSRLGYLEGHHMANAFNLLRENDLIWSFVINNYLLGREPMPFDLLYWNSDSTRMPAAMHSFYLRNMYQQNLLRVPGGLQLAGVPIDLRRIGVPAFFLSAREDHIAPWQSTYAGALLLSGPVHFVLAASGHVAGVINPPAAKKYAYWTNDALPPEPAAWFASAAQHAGSWWSEWARWLTDHAGGRVPARRPGDGELPALEDCPGAYVKKRLA